MGSPGRQRRAPEDMSGDAQADAALWELAEVLAEIARNPDAQPDDKEKPAGDDGEPNGTSRQKAANPR